MAALDYEIRVLGSIPDDAVAEIGDVRVTVLPMNTILRGTLVDQAALHGVINRLHGLGLELLEVRRIVEGSTISQP